MRSYTVIRDDPDPEVPAATVADILDNHSSVADAARTAARWCADLILTHSVPALAPGDEANPKQLAAQHFDGTVEPATTSHTATILKDSISRRAWAISSVSASTRPERPA